ncbi:glutamate receptor 2.9-like [Senna tora]|uniref:Glutamate receptor 2.9-like n=1 Tax=Senna tora TaxID=362788 RepID=A0A834SNW9_9FABA|nr:glutamate receptor 2.9-like [Senna tora]
MAGDTELKVKIEMVDGVVGDVTITANRTNYVEFTHPYMESGGAIQFMERGNANADHARLQNSTHKEMLRGVSIVTLPLAQVVLPQRESVSKKSSRFVLVTWLILAFVLMQSYSASLSSFLTVGQLRANLVNDMKSIGYQCGSEYLRKLLEDQLSFKAERLRPLCSIEEYREALDRGRYNGGVDAIFDEVPYIKVFLNQYGSSNYTMVGPRYHTNGGFGFAFPRYSNLTFEFSRAILNMSDSMEMKKIERRYFGRSDEDEVVASSSSDTPSLTTRSFSGLFMITGILTSLALMVSERHVILKKVMSARKYLFISRSAKPSLESGSGDGSISRRNVGTAAQYDVVVGDVTIVANRSKRGSREELLEIRTNGLATIDIRIDAKLHCELDFNVDGGSASTQFSERE